MIFLVWSEKEDFGIQDHFVGKVEVYVTIKRKP